MPIAADPHPDVDSRPSTASSADGVEVDPRFDEDWESLKLRWIEPHMTLRVKDVVKEFYSILLDLYDSYAFMGLDLAVEDPMAQSSHTIGRRNGGQYAAAHRLSRENCDQHFLGFLNVVENRVSKNMLSGCYWLCWPASSYRQRRFFQRIKKRRPPSGFDDIVHLLLQANLLSKGSYVPKNPKMNLMPIPWTELVKWYEETTQVRVVSVLP